MADLIGRMLRGGGLPDLTQPSGGPWRQLGGMLGAGLKAGFPSPAEAGTITGEKATEYFRVGAGIEGTREYAENLAAKLATFADQPTVRDSLIQADKTLQKNKWAKALVISLTKSQVPIDPTLLSPAEARTTFTGERRMLEQARPGMGELGPEKLSAWTRAYEPSMRMQRFAGAPEFRGELKTPEERQEWEKLTTGLFGRVPIGAKGAAGRLARREPTGVPSERYERWTGRIELGQVPKTQTNLALFLTEGVAGMGTFGVEELKKLTQTPEYAALRWGEKRKGEEMTLPERLGYKDIDDFDPEAIKAQPLLSRLATFVQLVDTIRMDERTMGFIFQNWFEDLLGPAAPTPAWAGSQMQLP